MCTLKKKKVLNKILAWPKFSWAGLAPAIKRALYYITLAF